MIDTFAWIGTGQCDPNKGIIEFLVLAGMVTGWVGIIVVIKNLSKSTKSKLFKYGIIAILIVGGIIGTLLAWGFTWLAYGCSRY